MLSGKNFNLAFVFGAIILFSCGKDVPCYHASSILNFVSFSDAETDSIILRQYVKNSAFDSLINSTIITRSNSTYERSNDTLHIQPLYGGDYVLESTFDYEVYMPLANKLFQISNITEKPTEMNMGISMDKQICINPLISYTVNGQVISGASDYGIFYLTK